MSKIALQKGLAWWCAPSEPVSRACPAVSGEVQAHPRDGPPWRGDGGGAPHCVLGLRRRLLHHRRHLARGRRTWRHVPALAPALTSNGRWENFCYRQKPSTSVFEGLRPILQIYARGSNFCSCMESGKVIVWGVSANTDRYYRGVFLSCVSMLTGDPMR